MKKWFVVGLACAMTTLGCGDDARSDGTDGGGGGGTDGGGGVDAGPGFDGGPGFDAGGGGGGDSYTVTFGPVEVGPGVERTECVIKRLGNLDPVKIGRIVDLLGSSSHHMIVYRVNDETERPEPFSCSPFSDTLDPSVGSPLVVSQRAEDEIQLPEGVGFPFDANQMIRLEMHYINTTTETVTLESSATFHTIPESEYVHPADFLFIGTIDIEIPPRSTTTVGPRYFPLPGDYSEATFFAITGHEHRFGTGVKVWTATDESDPGALVYGPEPFLWDEPETVEGEFTVPAGGGFKFECTWNNTSDGTVRFGESANQEMCFFWAYYYPGTGSKVCFQSNQAGTSLTDCCPGGSLCSILR